MAAHAFKRGKYWLIRLSLPPDSSAPAQLRRHIREAAVYTGFAEDALGSMLIGATEACSNAVRHGSYTETDSIEASIQAKSNEMIIRLLYKTTPFVLTNPGIPNLSEYIHVGHGHYLMRESLDEIHYYFRKGSVLARLVKRTRHKN